MSGMTKPPEFLTNTEIKVAAGTLLLFSSTSQLKVGKLGKWKVYWLNALGLCKAPRDKLYCNRCYINKIQLN